MAKRISNLKTSVGIRSLKAFKTPSPDESCEFILSHPTTPAQHSQPEGANDFLGFSRPCRGSSRAHGRHLLAAAPTRGSPTGRNSAFWEKGF